jgi:hypothetical protein
MYVKRSHLLVVILLTGSAVLGATLTTRQKTSKFEGEKVEAQTATDGTRWEYCIVTKANYAVTNRTGQYWITYFRNSGFKVENIEDNATSNAALAKAIAKLGDEGWELVSVGPMEVNNAKLDAFYFKRPKQRP